MCGCTSRSWRSSLPTAENYRLTSRLELQTRQREETLMSGMLINLIIQLVAGAIGGNVAGGASKDLSLGTAGNMDIGALVGQFAGGGVAGALLTAIVGLIKNRVAA